MKYFVKQTLFFIILLSLNGYSQTLENDLNLTKVKKSLNEWLEKKVYPFSDSDSALNIIEYIKASGFVESNGGFMNQSVRDPYLSFFIKIDSIYIYENNYYIDIVINEYPQIESPKYFIYNFPYYTFDSNNFENKINPIYFLIKKVSSSLKSDLKNIKVNVIYPLVYNYIFIYYSNKFEIICGRNVGLPKLIEIWDIPFLVLGIDMPAIRLGLNANDVEGKEFEYTMLIKEFCDSTFKKYNDNKNPKRYLSVSNIEFYLQGIEKLITGKENHWEYLHLLFEPSISSNGEILLSIYLDGNWYISPNEPDSKVIQDTRLDNHLDLDYDKELRAFGFDLQNKLIDFLKKKLI